MFNQYRLVNKTGTWQEKLNILKAARAEYANLFNIMSDAEKMFVRESITELRDSIQDECINAAISKHRAAAENVNAAIKEVEAAKQKERTRWDAARLSGEMGLIEKLVSIAVKSPGGTSNNDPGLIDRLKGIYTDATGSGDIHKRRAAAEVFTGLVSMIGNDPDVRVRANMLAKQAERDAEDCRSFPEIDTAVAKVQTASDEFNQARATLANVDRALGYTHPNDTIGNYTIHQEMGTTIFNDDGTIEFAKSLNEIPFR